MWLGNSPPNIHKKAVDPIQSIWGIDGKACLLPDVVRVRGGRGSTEATQNQVVVCVVLCIPERHVL